MHAHNHDNAGHQAPSGDRQIKIALAIVVMIMVAEVIGGILSNSLALLSDAGHMLVDALALGLALFAIIMARRPATETRTYGYHRVEIMAALANGVTLTLLAIYIAYEAYQRFAAPPEVQASLMLLIASIGLVANVAAMLVLRRAGSSSLNIRAALWHVIGDTVSSVGVIAAAGIMAVTGWYVADPIIAVLIAVLILLGSIGLVKKSVDILLETVPGHVEMDKVVKTIKNVPGVKHVHDVHIWTITSNLHALSAHLIIEDQRVSTSGEIVDMVNRELSRHFNITHTTLQLECGNCETCPSGLICDIGHHRKQT
ncbi:MAG: cation transporter [Chloroflexi bacterium]|nr:cation transporter [Chloroflexota bacterium]